MKPAKSSTLPGTAATAALLVLASGTAQAAGRACPGDNGGITLPAGFCATVFADHIGHARQMAVGPDGTLYVNTWSGVYFKNDKVPDGGFLVALRDRAGNGKADEVERFGPSRAEGNAGGTGIALHDGKLYAETNDKIVAYRLPVGTIAPTDKPEVIVSGLPITGDHPMHPFMIDPSGDLFVDLGTATNACEERNRTLGSVGRTPCTEKDTRGGIWRYDAGKTGQTFSPAGRYATGDRNAEGFGMDSGGRIFVTQHGRDQLAEDWPRLYSRKQGQELPAEEVVQLGKGADYGWPTCYYDAAQGKLVLAPEYGGDGGRKVGECAGKTPPVAAFPAHWAPNDLKVYTRRLFPTSYADAAFIAFHGSWNRAPGPQGGFNVVVQPMKDGRPSGRWEVFADGFAGHDRNPGQATHRPSGLAIGPDGALFISDDVKGTIWRVTYSGDASAPIEAAPAAATSGKTVADAKPPEGMHPDAGAAENEPLAPAGTTREEVALGDRIFHGEAADGTCATCHGNDARGLPIGPELIKGKWLWSDGSLRGIEATVTGGVPDPKAHPGMMPPMGGVPLSPEEVKAVAAYVYALNHRP